jgi:hypothetical protein
MTASIQSLVPQELKQLQWRPLFAFQIGVAKPSVIGKTPGIDRRVGEITGGFFEGERLRGKILTGGSDWQTVRSDGAWTLDVRLVMETDDGHLIGMTYKGIRHGPQAVMDRIAKGDTTVKATDYYLRAAPFFETSSEKYGWLNSIIAIASGHRLPTGPIYQVFEIT